MGREIEYRVMVKKTELFFLCLDILFVIYLHFKIIIFLEFSHALSGIEPMIFKLKERSKIDGHCTEVPTYVHVVLYRNMMKYAIKHWTMCSR
jgi:hypothetical protein